MAARVIAVACAFSLVVSCVSFGIASAGGGVSDSRADDDAKSSPPRRRTAPWRRPPNARARERCAARYLLRHRRDRRRGGSCAYRRRGGGACRGGGAHRRCGAGQGRGGCSRGSRALRRRFQLRQGGFPRRVDVSYRRVSRRFPPPRPVTARSSPRRRGITAWTRVGLPPSRTPRARRAAIASALTTRGDGWPKAGRAGKRPSTLMWQGLARGYGYTISLRTRGNTALRPITIGTRRPFRKWRRSSHEKRHRRRVRARGVAAREHALG